MEALHSTASEMLAEGEQKRLKRHYLLEALTFRVSKIRKCRETSKQGGLGHGARKELTGFPKPGRNTYRTHS